jgi:hypothetical protein
MNNSDTMKKIKEQLDKQDEIIHLLYTEGEAFRHAIELLEAEEKGEIVRLTLKTGDKVYMPFKNDPIEATVVQTNLYGFYLGDVCYSWESLGRLFFVAKEAAEKALREDAEGKEGI